jgi:hypothetical protein
MLYKAHALYNIKAKVKKDPSQYTDSDPDLAPKAQNAIVGKNCNYFVVYFFLNHLKCLHVR